DAEILVDGLDAYRGLFLCLIEFDDLLKTRARMPESSARREFEQRIFPGANILPCDCRRCGAVSDMIDKEAHDRAIGELPFLRDLLLSEVSPVQLGERFAGRRLC